MQLYLILYCEDYESSYLLLATIDKEKADNLLHKLNTEAYGTNYQQYKYGLCYQLQTVELDKIHSYGEVSL